ncbi:MAG: hypothetical protein PHE79_11640 [Eubacteriales bacterium]|nr:hypothetical protein [Eubacteriales bacterium]
MGLLNRKPAALAMLGSIDNVRQLIKPFDSNGINLIEKDFVTIDELLEGIRENRNVEYILISDSALVGIDDGKYEVVKEIRKNYEDVFIAMFFNYERPDEKFKNWAFGYSVYGLYYPDGSGNFNFKNIIPQLLAKSMPTKQREAEDVESESQSKQEEIDSLKRVISGLQDRLKLAENDNDSEAQKRIESEVALYKDNLTALQEDKAALEKELREIIESQKKTIKKAVSEAEIKAKEVEELKRIVNKIEKPNSSSFQMKSSVIIGVFSLSRGAGSTRTSVQIGEHFARDGFSTAVIAYDDKPDLKYKKRGKANYFIPDKGNKKIALLSALKQDYQFIILDFGNLFYIAPHGELDAGGLTDRKDDIEEFLRCHYKVGVGFSDEWHVGRLNYFINNDLFHDSDTSIFCIEGIDNCSSINKYDLNICERNSDIVLHLLYEWLGLKLQERTRGRRIGIFARKNEED